MQLDGGRRPLGPRGERLGFGALNLLIAILLVFGAAGAGVGWMLGTRTLYQKEFDALEPIVPQRRVIMATLRRGKFRRLVFTAVFFFLGVLTGLAFLMYLARLFVVDDADESFTCLHQFHLWREPFQAI